MVLQHRQRTASVTIIRANCTGRHPHRPADVTVMNGSRFQEEAARGSNHQKSCRGLLTTVCRCRLYNQSCEEELFLQSGADLCCTLDNVPLISKCGALPPESCFFSLICSTGSFMVMMIVLLRYAHVIEKHQNCVLNTASLSTGWICAAGLIVLGNFQVDNAKVLHYVGAGIAFPTSMLFVCLQSALTYRLAKTQGEYSVAHLRLCLTLLSFVALVLSGVFFCQESFVLQHASAIFEWVFCVIIILFYGTFAFEFAGMSEATMAVLARGGALGPAGREHKVEALGGPGPHQSENML
uniref:Zgc:154058 n=1 Tax=Takifugu rubripes TaxID=31033 RepID=A0A674M8Z6_TAKRU